MPKDMESKTLEVHRFAREFFNTSPDWVSFFREVLGLEGAIRRVFRDQRALAEFEQTREYAEIQQMMAKLREQTDAPTKETTRVITIRLPQSLHEALTAEAHDYCTSVNKLCISKLMQMIDEDLVPAEKPALAKAKARQRAPRIATLKVS